ncbi:MAG: copper chaperone PCu(A)C [Pseudomonadota bacterium]
MKLFSRICLLAFSVLFAATLAHAHKFKVGSLHITQPEMTAPLPGAKVTAGYLVIVNKGQEADRLVAVKADFAGKSEIHTMEMNDGVMKMRPVDGGLEIPAGASVVLEKGGLHLMFMKLQNDIDAGQLKPVTLVFEKAGEISIEMNVTKPGKKDHGDHGSSDHSNHTH